MQVLWPWVKENADSLAEVWIKGPFWGHSSPHKLPHVSLWPLHQQPSSSTLSWSWVRKDTLQIHTKDCRAVVQPGNLQLGPRSYREQLPKSSSLRIWVILPSCPGFLVILPHIHIFLCAGTIGTSSHNRKGKGRKWIIAWFFGLNPYVWYSLTWMALASLISDLRN